jgi:hypothetical protein
MQFTAMMKNKLSTFLPVVAIAAIFVVAGLAFAYPADSLIAKEKCGGSGNGGSGNGGSGNGGSGNGGNA